MLAYTDPNKPYILYNDAYDIACGGALVQTVLYTCGKYCGTTNDEIRRYVRCTNFMNALFVQIARRHAAGKLLVIYIFPCYDVII